MSSAVFGPVPSRRLERSLGVDLMPHKTCLCDCDGCQPGGTTCHTVRRQPDRPVASLVREPALRLNSMPGYITLAGSGEPTLFRPIAHLVLAIRRATEGLITVLINGSPLHLPAVQKALAQADVVARRWMRPRAQPSRASARA